MKNYILLVLFVLLTSHVKANDIKLTKHDIAISDNKEHIAYNIYGTSETTLIFIHGWSCDSRYWREQLDVFAKNYQVITIDLAGHGHSSSTRNNYTINSFAKDVEAVIAKENIKSAILIGHSMGGAVVAEVAKNLPTVVKGIIGVDTLHDVALRISQTDLDASVQPFIDNYSKAMNAFTANLFTKNTSEDIKEWISKDMHSSPKSVAVSAFQNFMAQYRTGESSSVFDGIKAPVTLINARLWPTNTPSNKSKIKNFKLLYIKETGHFPMLENPQQFNTLLTQAIQSQTHIQIN